MPSYNKKDMIFVLFAVIITSLLSLLPVSFLSLICSGLLTAVIGYTVTRHHYGYVAFICFINLLIYLIFSGSFLYALSASVPFILCGLTLGICYNLKFSVFKLLTIFTSVYVLGTTLNIKIAELALKGQNTYQEIVSLAGDIYRDTLFSAYGTQITSAEIDALVSEITGMLLRFSPSFIVIGCICFSLLCFYLFKRLNQFRKNDVSHFENFSLWKPDKFMSITFFVLMGLTFVVPSGNFLSDVLLNMVTVMSFVFFLLGLSLVEYKLEKTISKSALRKLIIIFIAFFSIMVMGIPFIVLATAGAVGGCIDLRTKKFLNR